MSTLFYVISLSIFLYLGFIGAPFWIWSIFIFFALSILSLHVTIPLWLVAVVATVIVLGVVRLLRAQLISKTIMDLLKHFNFLPNISDTEREAIEAGTVWLEADLFSGKPDFEQFMSEPTPELTTEERVFLQGPVHQLCSMIDDWKIWQERKLPEDVWKFIKEKKFLGLIIPKEYGGLGFSPLAHSEVIRKLASRSLAASIHVMVPNSLGPAELLINYGTDEQRKRLLPKLALGEEIPCFALTEPGAGSDAGSIVAEGILFKGNNGELLIRLNWEKRWTTLASIATLIGLAFKLKDPDHLLSDKVDVGITCALIPSRTAGVILGDRHDPLGVPFYNCPNQGKNVIVPADVIVGGIKNAGRGWQMLMECLAAGRGISFPAQTVGSAQLVTRLVSAHALVRQQFGISIGRFEGVQEPLSKIVCYTYMLEALRELTLTALQQGKKPAVVTAIAKYYCTEFSRVGINHAMDIMGGAGISLGPKNLIAPYYIAAPIGITVEGANILTRTLMIFGQGAMRAHPFAFQEIKALEAGNVQAFDQALWGHVGHMVRNTFRSGLLSISRGWLSFPANRGSLNSYYRKLTWASASFAILADVGMVVLGGKLKFKESLTGRFADILAFMFIGTAILKKFEADGSKEEQLPLVHASMSFVLGKIQHAFSEIYRNIEVPGLTWVFRGPIRLWSNLNTMGGGTLSDRHIHKLANLILDDEKIRDYLTHDIYYPQSLNEQLFYVDQAVIALKKAEVAERKIKQAIRDKKLPKKPFVELVSDAVKLGVITEEDVSNVKHWHQIRYEVIKVDSFSESEYMSRTTENPEPSRMIS